MYAGRSLSFFHAELVSILTGLGYAAIDEYEKIIRARDTIWPPFIPRYQHHHFQRTLGLAMGMVSAAKRLALDAGDTYMEHCRRGFQGGEPFSLENDLELYASLEHGGRLVWEAIEMLFRTSGSSGAKDGERMQRYYRDASIYRGHISAQYDNVAQLLAQVHLGLATGF
jgi:3-hydroxy-9,10-secoandrosta-1,3,5(10)-triene-9,17-dione monooxygenase